MDPRCFRRVIRLSDLVRLLPFSTAGMPQGAEGSAISLYGSGTELCDCHGRLLSLYKVLLKDSLSRLAHLRREDLQEEGLGLEEIDCGFFEGEPSCPVYLWDFDLAT